MCKRIGDVAFMIAPEHMIFGFNEQYDNEGKIVFIDRSTINPIDVSAILNKIFNPKYLGNPYTDEEYRRDWMAFISLCINAAAFYKSFCSENMESKSFVPGMSGAFMDSDEAMSHTGCYPPAFKVPETWSEILTGAYSYIESRETATKGSVNIPRAMQLKNILNISDFSYFTLQCSLFCSLDRGFERMFIILQGNENIPYPMLGTVQTLYFFAFPNKKAGWLGNKLSIENRLLFETAPADKPVLLRPLILKAAAFNYLMSEPYISRELNSCAKIIGGYERIQEPLFLDDQLVAAHNSLLAILLRKEPRLCILKGAVGSGRKHTLQWLANKEKVKFIIVDLDRISLNTGIDSIADELLSLALFDETTLCFSMNDSGSILKFPDILSMLVQYNLGAFILVNSPVGNIAGFRVNTIDYPVLDLDKSLTFWERFSSDYNIDQSIHWPHIASKYFLTAGQIQSAICSAADGNESQPINEKMISAAVLLGNSERLSTIADRVKVFYTWDNLVLSDTSKQMLKDVCDRIKYRHTVEIQRGWISAYGNGLSILLYGPPGTGKTMSAQVIAGELGLPLYRINLAQIISKYIGETAKNINAVFDEAKSSNVILFFDEADALFAKRTDVKNSNDRHANSESSYLLQKVEEYSGVSILATNLFSNFDEAFCRRINYIINVSKPDAAQRLELWKSVIPHQENLAPDVDFKPLAENLEFSGSVIKAAALQAAYYAASEGEDVPIGMGHLARAIRQELQKLGMTEPIMLKMF